MPGGGGDELDVDLIADSYASIPGGGIDFANKLMKPVTNYVTTYRRLFTNILDGADVRDSYQAMARWVADNPPFPGRVRLRGERVDLHRIEQNLLVVTAGADHIAPREGTLPLLDLVASEDVTH